LKTLISRRVKAEKSKKGWIEAVGSMKVIKGGKNKGKTDPKNNQYDNDWEAIENDLLTTTLSIRAIARKHNISDTAIRKYIKKEGIERDLSLKVKAAVRYKLLRNPVRKKTQVRTKTKSKVQTKKPTEKEIVEAAAEEYFIYSDVL